MNAPAAPVATPNRSGALPMLALIAGLLALPFMAAASLYLGGWRPAALSNRGHLLTPPPELPASGLTDAGGRPLATAGLTGKWLLVLAGRGPCGPACREQVDEMRRVQVSLYKDMGRLRRVVLSDAAGLASLADLATAQPDLRAAAAPAGWLPAGLATEDGTYAFAIVDPQGRLVLTYPPDTGARDLRADLERLLKFAWTG